MGRVVNVAVGLGVTVIQRDLGGWLRFWRFVLLRHPRNDANNDKRTLASQGPASASGATHKRRSSNKLGMAPPFRYMHARVEREVKSG